MTKPAVWPTFVSGFCSIHIHNSRNLEGEGQRKYQRKDKIQEVTWRHHNNYAELNVRCYAPICYKKPGEVRVNAGAGRLAA
ncbi:hypothetical protein [Alteromonas sp. H39]|uniref:hypothetical protein n=1 Tax=Alteromonas sp. H39 TaxID=3389876 RepID=UPI0039DFFDF6